jgi:hypothetical protein
MAQVAGYDMTVGFASWLGQPREEDCSLVARRRPFLHHQLLTGCALPVALKPRVRRDEESHGADPDARRLVGRRLVPQVLRRVGVWHGGRPGRLVARAGHDVRTGLAEADLP